MQMKPHFVLALAGGATLAAVAVILIARRRRGTPWHQRPLERAPRPMSDDEAVDEMAMQSFPSSDPPSY
jgi:hypothetical protein